MYRIVFQKIEPEYAEAFTLHLIRDLNFTREKAQHIVKHSPAVLYESPYSNKIKLFLNNIRPLNANVSVRKVVKGDSLPFYIDESQLRWISKLLNMTLRAGVDTAMLYLVVEPENEKDLLLPLTDREKEIGDNFRESDSLYAIDDNKILFLGFTTDDTGLDFLIPKLAKAIEKFVKYPARIKIGDAIFPRDGYSVNELIQVAQNRLAPHGISKKIIEKLPREKKPNKPAGLKQSPGKSKSGYKPIFKNARGTLLRDLTAMDPEVLWSGLCELPISDQKKFCRGLPYDSPLVTFFSGKITRQASPKNRARAIQALKDFAAAMETEKKRIEQKKNQAAVIAKLNRIESLSTIPSVALQVYNVVMDPESDIEDIQKIIQLDQVLTLKLLKLVNSPFYGLPQKINSVKEATVIIGTDEIMNMAFGLSLSESFKASSLEKFIDPRALWKHSVQTALIGRHLCQGMKELTDGGIFTACILHDFGKLFFIEHFSDQYRQIIELSNSTGLPLYDLEEEVFGYNHGIIGGIMAKKWNLPDSLVHTISFHHRPSASSNHSRLSAVTGFANYLCTMASESVHAYGKKAVTGTLLKDHMDILQTIFKDLTIASVDQAVEDTRVLLAENNDLLNLIS